MQDTKQTIYCPECNELLLKVCKENIGLEIEIICPKCKEKLMLRESQEKWEKYKKYDA